VKQAGAWDEDYIVRQLQKSFGSTLVFHAGWEWKQNRETSGSMGRGFYHPTVAESLGSMLMFHAGWEWKKQNKQLS